MQPAAQICIFEDEGASGFLPLTWTRPVFDLRCGAMTLAERIRRFFPHAQVHFQCRDYLVPVTREHHPDIRINHVIEGECLFINGRVFFDQALFDQLHVDHRIELVNGVERIAFWNALTPRRMESDVRTFRYPWELIAKNQEALRADFFETFNLGRLYDGVHRINPDRIAIGNHSVLKPGVVLDAEHGPIMIADHVNVMANAVIEGPAYIGSHSIVKIGAKIYGGTTIGPVCKIGGEVEGSIVHGYSNKQHDGFLGHSYIGEWCNLGADTNTSDLKNNYSNVKVSIGGKEIDTGSLFVGLIMGDHSKSGINTMFNTGTIVGVACNVFGGGFPPKFIADFSWVDGQGIVAHRPDKALQVAETVMNRRNVPMTEAMRRLLEQVAAMRDSSS